MSRRGARGFTLLEVLVAIAILGLGLTVILSSQVGLFSSAQRAQNLTVATSLSRCKMGEVELKLARDGYPLIDENDSGDCCGDESAKGFSCNWKIERVELPSPRDLNTLGDGGLSDDPGGLGPLGALASIQQSGGSSLGDGGISGLASLMSESGGTQGMASMVMSMVYPDLKPMLEASIRKVTVIVIWKEGFNERDLSVTQYVTDPQQGGLDSAAADDVKKLGNALEEQSPP